MSDLGFPPAHGVDEIRAQWASENAPHPLAHHGTNIVRSEDPDGTVRIISKAIGVGYKDRVGSAPYQDVVTRTSEGWRFVHRSVIQRQAPQRPAKPGVKS